MNEQLDLQTLLYERDGVLAVVTLNRPDSLNALNARMFDELECVFSRLRNDASVHVILLTGSGDRAFAAGADIRELVHVNSESGRTLSLRGQQVFTGIERCGKPVIACINGVALGGGCELALACSFRTASDKAVLGLPEAKLGLIPGYGGTQRLPRLVGRAVALRMMLTAQSVNAEEALRIGLVDEVVPAAELMTRARGLAASIAKVAPMAISGILQATAQGEECSLEEGLTSEAEIFGQLCNTSDKHEGITAFLEKRQANWQGK